MFSLSNSRETYVMFNVIRLITMERVPSFLSRAISGGEKWSAVHSRDIFLLEQLQKFFTNIKICLFLNLVWSTRLEIILKTTNLEVLSLLRAAGKIVLAFEQTEKHSAIYMYRPAHPEHSWLWSTAGKWPWKRAWGVKWFTNGPLELL